MLQCIILTGLRLYEYSLLYRRQNGTVVIHVYCRFLCLCFDVGKLVNNATAMDCSAYSYFDPVFSRFFEQRITLIVSLYSRQAGVSGFWCHNLERLASPRCICAVTRGFSVPTKTLSYDSCVTITIHHYCVDTCDPCSN